MQGWKQAFPDEHGTITGVYTSGKTVAIEVTWEGTHSGPMAMPDGQELPPSNKPFTVKSVQVIEVEDGKMKALRTYFDLMTPPPADRSDGPGRGSSGSQRAL